MNPTPSLPTSSNEFLSGIRNVLPILVGVAPFGMIYGVLAVSAGLPDVQAQAMSALLFAGSSQFLAVQLIATRTPYLVIILTVLVINLRHALYSASLAPLVRSLSPWWKILIAYLLTDEAYAIAIIHYQQPGARLRRHLYYLGAALSLWLTWQLSTAVGIFLGAQVPASWSLDFTLALTFIALVVPNVHDRPAALAALSAGAVAVAAYSLPYKLGLILAALVGIGVGLWSEKYWRVPA